MITVRLKELWNEPAESAYSQPLVHKYIIYTYVASHVQIACLTQYNIQLLYMHAAVVQRGAKERTTYICQAVIKTLTFGISMAMSTFKCGFVTVPRR